MPIEKQPEIFKKEIFSKLGKTKAVNKHKKLYINFFRKLILTPTSIPFLKLKAANECLALHIVGA